MGTQIPQLSNEQKALNYLTLQKRLMSAVSFNFDKDPATFTNLPGSTTPGVFFTWTPKYDTFITGFETNFAQSGTSVLSNSQATWQISLANTFQPLLGVFPSSTTLLGNILYEHTGIIADNSASIQRSGMAKEMLYPYGYYVNGLSNVYLYFAPFNVDTPFINGEATIQFLTTKQGG